MQKIIYTHTQSGQSWNYRLPKILRWNGKSVMGITEGNMAQFGIVKEVVELPDPPAPVKRYSKYEVMQALETAGLWAGVKAAIVDAGRWDAFLIANDLAEDNPDFQAMKAAIESQLSVDAEAILSGCETEG